MIHGKPNSLLPVYLDKTPGKLKILDSCKYGTFRNKSVKSDNFKKIFDEVEDDNNLNTENKKPANDSQSEQKASISKLLLLAKPERSLIGLALGAQAVSAGATILFPMALGKIVDNMSGGVTGDLQTLMVGLGGIFTLASIATGVRVSALSLAGFRVERNLRKRLFTSILKQETAFFDQRPSGELVNRLSSDIAIVSRTLTQNITKLMRAAITGTGAVSMILYTSPKLALVALAASPPIIIIARIFGRYARVLSRQVVDALASATEVASERISGIRTVRTFGAERIEAERYATRIDDSYDLAKKTAYIDGIYSGSLFGVAQLSLLGVLWIGTNLVADAANPMTIGSLASFVMYSAQLGASLSATGTAYGQLTRAQGSAFQILEVMNREPIDKSSTIHSVTTNEQGMINDIIKLNRELGKDASVEFDEVFFRYPVNSKNFILRGTSFDIAPGKITAVAGSSGSGKSTIASLIIGLYEKNRGKILFGGKELDDLELSTIRMQIAVVPQDPVLFNGTVAENIVYGTNRNVLMDEIIQASKDAASHEMILSLPKGYDTIVGERGQGLSGGQRARIAMCRALFRNPSLLILDEHSASLDAESERAIADSIQRTSNERNIPVLVIAHRPSTLKMADVVMYLENGRVVEQGRFDKLLKNKAGRLRKQFLFE